MKIYLFLFIFLPLSLLSQKVLVHSHNDYLQKYPLKTALAYKVNSIEVDVAWYNNQIKVSHLNLLLKNKPNFEELYLKPLLAKKDSLQSVKFLFVDIKSGGKEILVALNNLFVNYPDVFSTRREDNSEQIKVIVSGSVNRIELYNDVQLNYLFVDGRENDLVLNLKSHISPIISANFSSLSIEEKKSLITKAHAQDKMVRFWNTTDNPKTWDKLMDLGVDIIGVDHIESIKEYLK